ncbi:MAG: hypothetical protein ABIR80_04665, partial [Opitutaceae bacterium]
SAAFRSLPVPVSRRAVTRRVAACDKRRGQNNDRRRSTPEILILKADRVYVEALHDAVHHHVRGARIRCAMSLAEAEASLARKPADLLITGLGFPDGDALDMLPRWMGSAGNVRQTLIVTTRKEPRLLLGLKELQVDGVVDSSGESLRQLQGAVRTVLAGGSFWSRSMMEHLDRHVLSARSVVRRLTRTEQMVLAVVGDGSDDETAAAALRMTSATIASVRRDLHRKLNVRQKGELQRLALQLGFVRIDFHGVVLPGLEMLLAACSPRRRRGPLGGKAAGAR